MNDRYEVSWAIDGRWAFVAFFFLVATLGLARFGRPPVDGLAQVSLQLVFGAVALALAGPANAPDRRERLGFGPSRLTRLQRVGAFVGCLVVAVAVSNFLDENVRRVSGLEVARPILQRMSTIFLLVFMPAIFEEVLFRGALLSFLIRRAGPPIAIALSAILFASVHANAGSSAMLFALVLGVCLGLVAHASGSIREVVWIHAANNAAFLATHGA